MKTTSRIMIALTAVLIAVGGLLLGPAANAAPLSAPATLSAPVALSASWSFSTTWPFNATLTLGTPWSRSTPSTATPAKKHKVTVPKKYVYKPKLGRRHDYCTDSPDEFPAPGAPNASFRGPCARHDMCYDAKKKKSTCDKALKADMYTNCEYWYGTWNPLRYACKSTALLYYAVVIVNT